jgi:ubiquinone biosynthesis monooxygenase Coq7
MNYQDSKSTLDTPKKILKVNHAGEFGAVNIYRSQLFVARILRFAISTFTEAVIRFGMR